MIGRPSDYSLETITEICARLAGGEPLVKICRDEGMPHVVTVYRWLAAHEEFRKLYARAREDQADTLADEMLQIADTPQLGVKKKTGKDGVETTEGDMTEHRKLQIDTRKWIAAKLKPKKYGERVEQHVSGELGTYVAQPIPVEERNTDRLASPAGAAADGDSAR